MGVFRFKNFSVCDDNATMKVGTDAVLLGAWADIENVNSVLDVGTGSGIIALMIAQRTNNTIAIDAIELLEADAQQASENVSASPWPERISVINISIQRFQSEKKYDLIICNPPFFTKSLLPPSNQRTSVRHDTQLTFDELLVTTTELLSAKGKLCVILPPVEADTFIKKAESLKLFLNRQTRFFTREGKPQERVLLQFERKLRDQKNDSLLLYASSEQWSDDYWQLTRDFYLKRS